MSIVVATPMEERGAMRTLDADALRSISGPIVAALLLPADAVDR
jgi:hypothetical protein